MNTPATATPAISALAAKVFRKDRLQSISNLRQDILNLIAQDIIPGRYAVDEFFDHFWLDFPDYKPDEKMAELGGISEESMVAYYDGKRAMPVTEWRALLVNALYHINATQLKIALGEV